MAAGVLASVNWAAVSAITGVAALVIGLLVPVLKKRRDRRHEPTRIREKAAERYETQLKVTAKRIDDAAAKRLEMSSAQRELENLSRPEVGIARVYGNESAVHWVTRLNRELLRRAFEMARDGISPSDGTFHELVTIDIDNSGLAAFTREQTAAMQQTDPVRTFTSPALIRELAQSAQLEKRQPAYYEQLEKLLGDQ